MLIYLTVPMLVILWSAMPPSDHGGYQLWGAVAGLVNGAGSCSFARPEWGIHAAIALSWLMASLHILPAGATAVMAPSPRPQRLAHWPSCCGRACSLPNMLNPLANVVLMVIFGLGTEVAAYGAASRRRC